LLLGVVLRTDVVAVPRHARVGRILAVSGRHRRLLTVDVDAEIDVGLRLRRRGGLGRGGLGRDRLGDGLGRGGGAWVVVVTTVVTVGPQVTLACASAVALPYALALS